MEVPNQRCKFGHCTRAPVATFALVDLCIPHYTDILLETTMYYEGRLFYRDRTNYHKISYLIPWRNKERKIRGTQNERMH